MKDQVRNVLAKPGEKVVFEVAQENLDRGYKPFPQGAVVEVTGFARSFSGRVGESRPPGIYINPQWIDVRDEAGREETVWAGFLHNLPEHEGHRIPQSEMRLGDLPETSFWEWDVVRTADGEVLRIVSIIYGQIGMFRNDGVTPMSIYVCGTDTNYATYREDEVELVERGLVWRRAQGEELVFADLGEEMDFHLAIGEYEDLRDPQFGGFTWQIEDALAAIDAGEGHGLTRPPLLGGAITVVRFDDEEFGERLRAATLEGFGRGHPNRM